MFSRDPVSVVRCHNVNPSLSAVPNRLATPYFPAVMINSTCNAAVDGAVTRCSVSCWLDLLCVSFMLLNLITLQVIRSQTQVSFAFISYYLTRIFAYFLFYFAVFRMFLQEPHLFGSLSINFYKDARPLLYLAISTTHLSNLSRTYLFIITLYILLFIQNLVYLSKWRWIPGRSTMIPLARTHRGALGLANTPTQRVGSSKHPHRL